MKRMCSVWSGGEPNSHIARHCQRVLKSDGDLEEVGVGYS